MEENDRRNYFKSISTKVWDRAGIELATPESEVRLASVARHVNRLRYAARLIRHLLLRAQLKHNVIGMHKYHYHIWAVTCDFQQCGILTSVYSDEPV